MADILIVDDDIDLALTLGELLALEGHAARFAHDGREGLLAIDAQYPDLVILDVEMPELDGPGMAVELVVQDVGRERIPIIILSAYQDLPAVAARLGVPYTLPKPSSPEAICALVARALTERAPPCPPRVTP